MAGIGMMGRLGGWGGDIGGWVEGVMGRSCCTFGLHDTGIILRIAYAERIHIHNMQTTGAKTNCHVSPSSWQSPLLGTLHAITATPTHYTARTPQSPGLVLSTISPFISIFLARFTPALLSTTLPYPWRHTRVPTFTPRASTQVRNTSAGIGSLARGQLGDVSVRWRLRGVGARRSRGRMVKMRLWLHDLNSRIHLTRQPRRPIPAPHPNPSLPPCPPPPLPLPPMGHRQPLSQDERLVGTQQPEQLRTHR